MDTLDSRIVPVGELTQNSIEAMFQLFNAVYENTDFDTFIRDLSNKDEALLVAYDSDIKGFTTMKYYDIDGLRILFSGDTVSAPDVNAGSQFPRIWLKSALERCTENNPLYWLLISKGEKTYRFLPTFFREFIPHPENESTELRQIRDKLGTQLFGEKYDSERGVIVADGNSDFLKQEFAKIPNSKTNNPYVKLFVDQNPGYIRGDELVCLTRLSTDNLTRIGVRAIK